MPGVPARRSSALSTARLLCEVTRIRSSGFAARRRLTASTITVVLPVPGGPWMNTAWPALSRLSSPTARFCGLLGRIPAVNHEEGGLPDDAGSPGRRRRRVPEHVRDEQRQRRG